MKTVRTMKVGQKIGCLEITALKEEDEVACGI